MTHSRFSKWSLLGLAFAVLFTLVGCGHSDEEMDAKQREIDRLGADLKAARATISDDEAKFAQSQADIKSLKEAAGLEAGKSHQLQQALAEYKQRADQLAAIEQRFRDLKARLDKLTQVGLKVVVRNNRMVIQLPGDVLFDSGKDELKQGGKDVLLQVGDVVRQDSDLSRRNFEVAGHTDNQKYPAGGAFHDNWGLSLARSRQVLLYLIAPKAADDKDSKKRVVAGKGGAGLDQKHWSASGFGDTDPIAGTMEQQTKDDQAKNRRVELVLQPNVEEMINLSNIH
ncbi:MAG: OmpA family protein [Polyangiaceae bacterium]